MTLKAVFDELVCLTFMVLLLSPFAFLPYATSNVDDVIQLEFVKSLNVDGGILILLKNSGSSTVKVSEISVNGLNFSIQPLLEITPEEICCLTVDADFSRVESMTVFLVDGRLCRVI
ncbi:MAG: hypothetical protein ACUVQ8_02135 [Nitrososphaeria archaeon]